MAAEVKICGITRPADAACAVAHGASYLGVIFASGPRLVDAGRAREVVAAAERVPVFGVFGAQPLETILRLRDAAGLSGAQLHGDYAADTAVRLRAEGMRVWRVARLAGAAELAGLAALAADADAVLVEPRVPGAAGGTGAALDLALAAAARHVVSGARFVLAGGLGPETVAAAVALVRPDVVDVSSGVESHPGIKDPNRLKRFLEAVVG